MGLINFVADQSRCLALLIANENLHKALDLRQFMEAGCAAPPLFTGCHSVDDPALYRRRTSSATG
ncbi:MAG: hypothetical protein R2932_15125 [Caldilineaceae bacterium]